MARRCIVTVSTSIVVFLLASTSEAAPAFKFKKSFSTYDADRSRVERRLSGGSSPIHYITPFMGMPMNAFNNFFAPASPMGNPASSSVYKLPLRLFSNGKPHVVFQGFPKTSHNVVDYLPQAMSNLIRLPLKYLSNAKPVGVYFKDPDFNYL